jgi:hypothetical protein
VLASAAVGVALGAAAMRHVPPADVTPAFTALDPAPRVWVILQPDDCDGRLEALTAIARATPPVAWGVAVPGGEAARLRVRARIAAMGWRIPVVAAGDDLPAAVRLLGYHHSPVLVVLDAARRVHFASRLPATRPELERWYTLLPLVLRPPESA